MDCILAICPTDLYFLFMGTIIDCTNWKTDMMTVLSEHIKVSGRIQNTFMKGNGPEFF
jgi:hypothetical protein